MGRQWIYNTERGCLRRSPAVVCNSKNNIPEALPKEFSNVQKGRQ